jgi:hypothetical protein
MSKTWTISQLVKHLARMKAELGDVPVYVAGRDGDTEEFAVRPEPAGDVYDRTVLVFDTTA